MKVQAVLKWMLIFVLAGAAALGAGGVWVWQNGNQLIRDRVLAAFDQRSPDLELRFGNLELISPSVVRLTAVEIRDRKANRPVMRAEDVVTTVDEPQLMEYQRVVLRSVRASGVDLLISRTADGRWNWQNFTFRKPDDQPIIPPTVVLEKVRARIQLEHGNGIPSANLIVTCPSFQGVPSSGVSYDFTGLLTLPGAGELSLKGDCDLQQKTFQLGGRLGGVTASQNLLDLARSTTPQIAQHLEQLDQAMARVLPSQTEQTTADAFPSQTKTNSAALVIGTSDIAPRFLGVLDVDFQVSKTADSDIADLKLVIDVRDGALSSSVVPIRLSDVRARFYWDNTTVTAELINARDGDALLTGAFRMQTTPDAPAPEATIHLEHFPVKDEIKSLMPGKSQKFFEHFQPQGTVSGDIVLRRFPSGKWLPVSLSGSSNDAAILFHKFRYPVTGIHAEIRQRPLSADASSLNDVVFDITAKGAVGNQTTTAVGWIRNPSPELEMRFDVHVDDLPIDTNFRNALDDNGRKVIDAMGISGTATADAACYRMPGLDQPTDIVLNASVRNSRMKFRGFPYDIERLSGLVEYRSKEKSWTFTDLHGWHGTGELTGEGSFRGLPAPGELNLTINAKNARLDADLFNALTPPCRAVWTLINPEGTVHLTSQIAWTAAPGQKAVVRLNDVQIVNTRVFPTPFPYHMQITNARLSYDPNSPQAAGTQHVEIQSLEAEHDGNPITARGWAGIATDGAWQLHLNELNAANLQPDDSLRAALPQSWRATLSRLSHEGRVSVESSELDFRGTTGNQAPVTAAWKTNLRLMDCRISAGLDLQHISGIVKADGSWDGYQLRNNGTIRLDQVEVLDMVIAGVHGPYSMTDDELILGSREIIRGVSRPMEVPPESRIRAQAYGGTLEMDGMIDLDAGSSYRFFGELRNALLERYAALHIPSQPSLKGVVNSWIYVFGHGDSAANLEGTGQLQIHPAALYENPVIIEMFNALSKLNFAVSDRTAFDYALMSFQIRDQAFWFDPIDLVGEALALRGRGRVGFGGDVVLDFFSRPAPPRGLRLPFTNMVTQWVNVQVRGTVDNPQTTRGSKIQLDESMRQFLNNFERNRNMPNLVIPNLLSTFPGQPQQPQRR